MDEMDDTLTLKQSRADHSFTALPYLASCVSSLQGVLLFEMLHGLPPFYHEDPMKM